MAPKTVFAMVLLVSQFLLLVPDTLGGVTCEELPKIQCAFAISADSKRCLLESTQHPGGRTEYQCRTSEVVVERMSDWIEGDGCVRACGVARDVVGISSDSLIEPEFTGKLCSTPCYQNCPNIVDLYFNLAAGEGVFLPELCEKQRVSPRRAMAELLSSGAAPGPVDSPSSITRRAMEEFLSSGAAPGPVASPPAITRRAMAELLSSGAAPGPVAPPPAINLSIEIYK